VGRGDGDFAVLYSAEVGCVLIEVYDIRCLRCKQKGALLNQSTPGSQYGKHTDAEC
jgi:hypothetical protein